MAEPGNDANQVADNINQWVVNPLFCLRLASKPEVVSNILALSASPQGAIRSQKGGWFES